MTKAAAMSVPDKDTLHTIVQTKTCARTTKSQEDDTASVASSPPSYSTEDLAHGAHLTNYALKLSSEERETFIKKFIATEETDKTNFQQA